MRRFHARAADTALARAERAARDAHIPALTAEVNAARAALETPAARVKDQRLFLKDVETLLASKTVVVDACRHLVRSGKSVVPLAARPVLFALARALGDGWPGDVPRRTLIACAFGSKFVDESHRARLRVEVGRLRAAVRSIADIRATTEGFALVVDRARDVVVLLPPIEEAHAETLALLADGEAWSSSALAIALETSQRSVQRALDSLAASGKVQAFGRGRARRWMTMPVPGFTTPLLLPAPVVIE
jgi:hypothetical protein